MVVNYAGLIGEFFGGPGFKIPLGSRDRIISKLHDALDKVLADPTVLSGLGQAARARVLQDFTWTAKARQIARVYDWILQGKPEPAVLISLPA